MTIQVIGAGFGRTGTLSLKHALEQLGYDKCYHMEEVFEHPEHTSVWAAVNRNEAVDWEDLFEGYQASVDWPSCNYWRQQMQRYPDAKVILSSRDPESWYKSVMNTIYPTSLQVRDADDETTARLGAWLFEIIWNGVFDGRMDDKNHCINVFLEHEAAVKREVPAERLLVHQAREGWEPLCRFLGCGVPDEPYPRVNSTEDFLFTLEERAAQFAGDS